MNTLFQPRDEEHFYSHSSQKQKGRRLLLLFILGLLLFPFQSNVYGQATPGGVPYTIEFWLRADYTHTLPNRVKEGENMPVWITVAGIERPNPDDDNKPSQNHWGRCPVNGNSSTGNYYSVPKLSYDGMNFIEAVEFEGSATQKLASMFAVNYANTESYYFFFVSELNTAKTSGSYAALLSFCNNSNGNGNNGIGWSGSGTGLWWNNGTSATARTQATIGKSYGITSYIRTNSTSLPMAVYHNGKKYEVGTGQTGTISGQHVFMANNGLDGSPFYGKIQEIIMLKNTGNQMIDKKELDKIHSYLAIKYGQTLDNTDQPNLYAANGAEIWTGSTNSGYTSGMFGLACDKGTNFFQKQGQSADDKRLTAFLGNALERRNAENENLLYAEGQNRLDSLTSYLIFGHNGLIEGNTGYSFPKKDYANGITLTDEDINLRSKLIYKAQATYCPKGSTTPTATSYRISFQTGFPALYMMVSSAPDFNPDNTRLYPLTGNVATNVLVNSGEYITFLVNEPGPGGVTVRMWLKADDTSNLVINSANNEVNSWGNSAEEIITYSYTQSTIDTSPTVTNSRPKYKASDAGMNYHPTLDFNPATCATKYPFLSSSNAVFSTNVPTYYTIITAANVRQFGEADSNNDEITYFMGFGATTPGSGTTGSDNARRPAMGIAKNSEGKGVARFWSGPAASGSINGTTGLFNPGATSITLFEVGTASADRYLQFESDGYSERMAGTANLASTSYSQLAGSSMLGIGSRKQRQLNGTMSEVIAFEGKLDANQKQQIYSYLGLKYGITLDLNKTNTAINYDYLLSDGTKVWPGTENTLYRGYHNNVAGLVRDNTSGLNNMQARSTDTGAIVRIGIGNSLGEDGVLTGLRRNMESLMWGHNGGSGTTNLTTNSADNCGGLESRMNRIWMLDNTRTQEDYTLLISAGGSQAASVFPYNSASYQVYLIVATSAAYVTGSPTNWTLIPGTYKDGEHYFNYTIPANTDYLYFTFGAKAIAGACESCGYEGSQTLSFAGWTGGNTSKSFNTLSEITPTVSLGFTNGSGASFYSGNPRTYAGKTLRITRQGTTAPTMETKVTLQKAATASFSIYEIDRRSSLYDKVTVYGLCGGNTVYPKLYYGGTSSASSYTISGNVATANSKTSSALSSVGKMNVEFTEAVEQIVIQHNVTGATSGWKRIGLSPIDFSCPLSVSSVNADGLAFRKGAPSEVYLCEDIQFTYKVYNANCAEKAVTFSETLPMGMYWVENSLSVGEYNESHTGFNVTYNNDLAAGASTLTIDKLFVPGGGEMTFFATARFVSEIEAESLGHEAPEAKDYSNSASLTYLSSGQTVVLESCDMRSSDRCMPTTVTALQSNILAPLTASITADKTTYSEDQVVEVTINLENKNDLSVSGNSLYVYFNEGFTYVTGSFTYNGTPITPTPDMAGSFYADGINLAAKSSGVVKFKLTAPTKENLEKEGSNVLPLGIEYSMEIDSANECASSVLGDANGSLDIPYAEMQVINVTGVELNKETTTIDKGQTEKLEATVLPANATNKEVTWSTSDPLVATVDINTGVVTAVGMNPTTKSYTATITVTTVDGNKTDDCIVTVNIPVTGITLSMTDHTFAINDEEELVATVLPTDASDKSVTWSVDDDTVVSLTGSGNGSRVIKGLKIGATTVRVKTNDGSNLEATCTITVIKRLITKIVIEPAPVSLVEGGTQQLTVKLTPDEPTDPSVTWSSGNNSIATVSTTGEVTAVSEGKVTITATANDGSNVKGTCEVTVTKAEIPVTGISLNMTTHTFVVGDEETLTATVLPTNATTDKSYTWSVEPSDVVSLVENGTNSRTVKGLKVGTAIVKVKTTEGGYEAICTITVNPRLVSSITITPAPVSLVEGETQQLTATVEPDEATDKSVTWSSGDNLIATVSTTGLVTAVKEGKVTITATANDASKKTGTCEVTVTKAKVDVTGISLNKTTLTLEKGATEMLIATVKPDDATIKDVTWTSSDPLTASVDALGNVTAHKNGGPVTITATSDDNEIYKATCAVTVITSPSGVSLSPSSLSLVVGENETLIATVSPEEASNKTVTWDSDNPGVATVVNGVVTARGVGTAIVTVTTANGKTATCEVTVSEAPISVTGITLDETTLELEKGTKRTLTAIISPDNATNKKVIWTSSDPTIASVDENTGEITAHKNGGPVTITATSDDNEIYKATCAVTVITSVTGVSISPATLSFVLGDSPQTLTATVSPEEASNKAVTWNSDKPGVATVVDGVVTAIGVGTATITVTTVDGGKTDTAIVYVSDAEIRVEDVEIVEDDFALPEGGGGQLTVRFTPANATNQNVTWSSSDDSIAEVSSTGWVTAKKAGEVTITVTTEDGGRIDEIKITITAAGEIKIFINDHLLQNFSK